ncbi:MAG: hypothetical protein ACREDF_11635 [Thermoplasmata archaeon]
MDAAPDRGIREGLARVLVAACLLPFATSFGVLFLATSVTQTASLFAGSLYILSFIFSLIGLGIAMDGFRRMTRRHA